MELEKNLSVSLSLIGSDGYLSVVGAAQLVQDAITELLWLHKLDAMTVKHKYNAIWLFVKTRIKFAKRIECMERFTVTAFASYVSLAKVHVDVRIKNSDGDDVICARTELCALDIEKQTIRRLPTIGVDDTLLSNRPAVSGLEFTKSIDVELQPAGSVNVMSTNIDVSHHTNNVEYVRLIMNTFSVDELENLNAKEMTLIYSGQSFENDVLTVKKSALDNVRIVSLEKEGRTVIKCEIVC